MNLVGKYTEAKVFVKNIEQRAIEEIISVCNHPIFKDCKIRIMPDCHSAMGCVIGFTSEIINNKIIPNLIGVDIGCGMLVCNLGQVDIDFQELDKYIRNNIPHGYNVNKNIIADIDDNFKERIFRTCNSINNIDSYKRHLQSLGSLGGGNHFIEISIDKENNKYLIVHSGSRNFGHRIATHHQNIAKKYIEEVLFNFNNNINKYKRENKIETDEYLEKLIKDREEYIVAKDLSFLQCELAGNYLEDMRLAQEFATLNRTTIANSILRYLDTNCYENFETVHNYISDDNYVRKGAVSAKLGEKLLIPINMRDGSILAIGKGNPEWNYSAPHGAGRLMSRTKAKEILSLQEFQEQMKDVYTTSVCSGTLDEAPMSYKPINEILDNIGDTVEVIDILKPIYNFKSN